MRNPGIVLSLSCAAAALLAGVATAAAQEVTLKVHHFLSPKAPAQTVLMEPWAKRVEEQSEGRIKVEIYPSMTLGGKPPQLIRQVRDGIVDVVWTVPGYTPGQFSRTEVFELPFVHRNDATATNLAIQDLYEDYLAEDFEAVHPLLVHVHAGNAFHMVDTPVRALADLEGLKIRIPTRVGGWMIEAFGANPVGMPVPELPQALSKKVVDGTLIPFEVSLPLKVHELTTSVTEGPDHLRFGTAVFLYAMNKDRYDALPDDLKAVIDANSGRGLAEEMGKAWMAVEEPGRKAALDRGNAIITLSEEETEKFRGASRPVVERWVAEMRDLSIDGEALLAAAETAIERHSNR